ncbi:MBL fold metallo-hydrolase [Candidatus Pacearchaeota archaeon]|jgi:L-ascorbate metabolism protein UlaG (beta-lactamase superfamily)|nr:MBL fold metallo-hydrolase [Candidatus Pacearchaeota archaeon]
MNISGLEVKWLGHSGFMIKNHKTIYIDPYNIKPDSEKADIILITHGHYDHCSVSDIKSLIKEGTKIFLTADAQSKITRFDIPIDIQIVEPNQEFNVGETKISTFPAYNIDKPFHQKGEGWVGYLVKINGLIIYFAGDTDLIPEMQKLTGHKQPDKTFVAILPIGGRFTMNVEEAVEAAKLIQPSLAIPMHYGAIIGTNEDAQEFVSLCKQEGIDAKILEKE